MLYGVEVVVLTNKIGGRVEDAVVFVAVSRMDRTKNEY